MITKSEIKEKSEKYNISFSNLLSGVICETILEIIEKGPYSREMYLSNASELSVDKYKSLCIDTLSFEYIKNIDKKMELLYLRDVLKDIISRAAMEALVVSGTVKDNTIHLQITVDEMYIPVRLIFSPRMNETIEGEKSKLKLTMYEDKYVEYLENPKEEIIVRLLAEIIDKLELINETEYYYDVYQILSTCPINGRKVKDSLSELLSEKNIAPDKDRLDTIKGYSTYHYMKKKWKVVLRQKKVSNPSWEDTVECLIKFLEPIWDCMEKNLIFLGDWMPQIKRFLD